METIKVLNDFEDCDQEWNDDPNGNHSIPKSTMTGKIVLRQVRQGHTVNLSFDDGLHEDTKKYLLAMADEYNLNLSDKGSYWMVGPEPTIDISAEDDVEELAA